MSSIAKNNWAWHNDKLVHIEGFEGSSAIYTLQEGNKKYHAKLPDLQMVSRGDQCLTTGDSCDQWMSVFEKDTLVIISEIDHSDKRIPIRVVGKDRNGETIMRSAQPIAIKLHKLRTEIMPVKSMIVLNLLDEEVKKLKQAGKIKNKTVTQVVAEILKQTRS